MCDKQLYICRVHESGNYELVMNRYLDESDENQMIMTSVHRDLNTLTETVATSWFTKGTGTVPPAPTPNPNVKPSDDNGGMDDGSESGSDGEEGEDDDLDALDALEEEEEEGGVVAPSPAIRMTMANTKRVDFSGVYKRTNTVNFEAFVGAQGVGYVQRKLAASMQLTHTITMDGPPFYSKFRLQEKGGPLDIDNTYDISPTRNDNATSERYILKKKYFDSCYWEGMNE